MFPLTVILNRLPFAPAALPAFTARMGASDFLAPPLPPSLFTLVGKRAYIAASANARISWVTSYSQYLARNGLRSRAETDGSPLTPHVLLLAGKRKPSALSNYRFRDSTPSRSALSVTIVPRQFSYLRIKQSVTILPARLDTRPVASSYRGGIPTR